MDAFIQNIFYNPLPLFGAALSLFAVLAFLVLLRGFLSGVMYLFTLNGNDDFLRPARIRVFWGFLLLVFVYCVWEILRWIGAIISGGPMPGTMGLVIPLLLLLYAAYWGANFIKKKKL